MRSTTPPVAAYVVAAILAMPAAVLAVEAPTGTATLVEDIKPVGGSLPSQLTKVGRLVYFTATDGSHGRELWVTDGTAGGTNLVEDIRAGAVGSTPRSLTRVGARLYFTADDGSHGRELWVSDGTAAGTRLVKDLTAGSRGSTIEAITDVAGSAYFDRDQRDLWRTNGTPKGTRLVRTFQALDSVGTATKGSTLFFPADGGLWKTDGTSASTKRLTTTRMAVSGLKRFKGRIYFASTPWSAPGADWFPRLWWSDGTKAGTKPLKSVYDPADLTVLGDALYFNAFKSDPTRHRLFRSDGTAAGTVAVTPSVRPFAGMVREVGHLWTNSSLEPDFEPDQLWTSDGSSAGTRLVYGGERDWFTEQQERLVCAGLDGLIYFPAGPGGPSYDWESVDTELWASDGTTEGTMEVADINPGGSSAPRELVRLGQGILFTAADGEHGRELWRFEP